MIGPIEPYYTDPVLQIIYNEAKHICTGEQKGLFGEDMAWSPAKRLTELIAMGRLFGDDKSLKFSDYNEFKLKSEKSVAKLTGEIEKKTEAHNKIKEKNAKWKEENPVSSALLTAAKVVGVALLCLGYVALCTTLVLIPVYRSLESKKGSLRLKIWNGPKQENARRELNAKEKAKSETEKKLEHYKGLKARMETKKSQLLESVGKKLKKAKKKEKAALKGLQSIKSMQYAHLSVESKDTEVDDLRVELRNTIKLICLDKVNQYPDLIKVRDVWNLEKTMEKLKTIEFG